MTSNQELTSSNTPYPLPMAVFEQNATKFADKIFLNQPLDGKVKTFTWQQSFAAAKRIAQGLVELGLQPNDKVAIISKNCAEWFLADFAIMMAGMVSVPIYFTANSETIRHVLSHSASKAVFVGKLDDLSQVSSALEQLNQAEEKAIKTIALPYPTIKADFYWLNWLQSKSPIKQVYLPTPDELMTIVYTSGSTGVAKGVALSYANFASVCYEHSQSFQISPQDRAISYLPLAHISERGVIQGPALYAAAEVFFVESLDTFIDDIRRAKPTLFISVPRLWAKFQSGIFEKIPPAKLDRLLSIPAIGKLVAYLIRKKLGLHRVRIFGSGSAPISPDLLLWYQSIGIDIAEGWGMTETSGLACSNFPFSVEGIGTIGKPCRCVEMTLSEAQEILIKGEAVFDHYYNDPKQTESAFQNGWFRTGDRAEIDQQGYFKIIGRLKEEFKTAKGKYVVPAPIESMLLADPLIEQACVIGSGKKQPVAVVILSALAKPMQESSISHRLDALIAQVNAQLESHEHLDAILVSKTEWTVENGYLTPTMKIKRSVIEAKYHQLLDQAVRSVVNWVE